MTLKDLEAELLKLKSRSRNWLIALGLALVLAVILLITVFKPKDSSGRVEQLDTVIRLQQEKIKALERLQSERDSVILEIEARLNERAMVQTKVIHHYEQIPIDVGAYDRERLRREVAEY